MTTDKDKSEYVLSTVGAEASVEVHDCNKRMSFFLASQFATLKYDGRTYEISQAGAQFVIKSKGQTKEAVIDIRPAFKAAVAALACFED